MKFNKKIAIIASSLLFAGWQNVATAGTVVIVNANNPESSLSSKQVKKIFLGKTSSFPGGTAVSPIDHEDSSATKKDFYKLVTKKDLESLQKYWSKRVFTGKGTPHKTVTNGVSAMEFVKNNPNGICYIDDSLIYGSVKVVYKL